MINLDMLRYSSCCSPVDRDSQHALLQGIVRHPGLKVITMTNIDVSEVDHELLAKALVKLEMVDISGTAMSALQKETLFSALENQNQVTALVLNYLDLSSVNPTLLGNVCSKIFSLELTLTAQQASSRFNELAYNNELMRESVRELKFSKTDLSQIDGSAFLLGVAKLAELVLSFSSLTPSKFSKKTLIWRC